MRRRKCRSTQGVSSVPWHRTRIGRVTSGRLGGPYEWIYSVRGSERPCFLTLPLSRQGREPTSRRLLSCSMRTSIRAARPLGRPPPDLRWRPKARAGALMAQEGRALLWTGPTIGAELRGGEGVNSPRSPRVLCDSVRVRGQNIWYCNRTMRTQTRRNTAHM